MRRRIIGAAATAAMLLSVLAIGPSAAAHDAVGLGTARSFAVLAGTTVTNTGPSVVTGDLGVSPGTAITGFPPGLVIGTQHAADAVAAQAQADLTVAYNDAAGRPCDSNRSGQDLGGRTFTDGTYCYDSSAQLTGTVTLNGQGDPDAVFIFQIGSTLTTASASTVDLINGAQACNVFWQVGSSATLGTNTTFVGNILALTSITLNTSSTVDGRTLARNGAVTLDSNVIDRATCAPDAEPTPTPTAEPTATPTAEPTATPTAEPTATPTPTAEPTATPTPTAEPTATPTAEPTPPAPTATAPAPTATAPAPTATAPAPTATAPAPTATAPAPTATAPAPTATAPAPTATAPAPTATAPAPTATAPAPTETPDESEAPELPETSLADQINGDQGGPSPLSSAGLLFLVALSLMVAAKLRNSADRSIVGREQ